MKLPREAWLQLTEDHNKWKLILPNSYQKLNRNSSNVTSYAGGEHQIIDLSFNYRRTTTSDSLYPVRLQSVGWNMIKIGPLIGILSVLEKDRLQGNLSNFIDILNMIGKRGGIGFVFTPDDIDWSESRIQGRFYEATRKSWIHAHVPFPDVVYNRVPNRNYEQQPDVLTTIQRLQRIPNLHLFNPRFFNKWELYQILDKTKLRENLPHTDLLTNQRVLENMVKDSSTLFIKPINSKAGNGILRLEKKVREFKLSTLNKGKELSRTFNSSNSLWRYFQPLIKEQDYVIQDAVPLLTYNGSPFDVRVLVQKNHEGKWTVTGIGFRAAGKHGITTHVPQGGKIIYADEALYPYFDQTGSKNLLNEIEGLGIRVAKALNQQFHELGEISMDLGITKEKRIWFFEANAKPMKFDEPEIRETSLQRLVDYCHYLSGFR